MERKMIILVGPSGSGKSAIINYLMAQRNRFYYVRSVTTRKMRSADETRYYDFVDRKTFALMSRNEDFLESSCYAGCWYGTPKGELENAAKNGQIAIKAMDINGALAIRKKLADECMVLFVYRDKTIVLQTLIDRTINGISSAKDIVKRIETLDNEYENIYQCDGVIRNTSTIQDAAKAVERFCFPGNVKKIAENVQEIILTYSQMLKEVHFFSEVYEKEEQCDQVGISYNQCLSDEVFRIAVKFETIFNEYEDSYLESIWDYAEKELRKWVADV